MNTIVKRRLNLTLWYALVAVIAAGALAWRYFWVPTADDFVYLRKMLPVDAFTVGNEPIVDLAGWWESVVNHYHYHISRLANFVAMGVLAAPRWVNVALCAAAVAVLPLLLTAFVGGRRGFQSSALLAFVALAVWLFCPWYNDMDSVDFLVNYVYAIDGILLLMILSRREGSLCSDVAVALLALPCCMMHESMTASFMVWLVADSLMARRMSRRRCLILGAAALAFIYLMTGPGTISRVGRSMSFVSASRLKGVFRPPFAATTVAFACLLWLVPGRMRRAVTRRVPLLLACVAGFVISVAGGVCDRALFFPTVLAIAFVADILRDLLGGRFRPALLMAFSAAVTLFLAAFFVNLTRWYSRIADDTKRIVAELERTGSNMVFADIITTEDLPWTVLGFPCARLFTPYGHLEYASRYYGYKDRIIMVFPEAWRNKPVAEWPKLPGDNPWHGGRRSAVFATSAEYVPAVRAVYGDSMINVSPLNRLLINLTGGPKAHRTTRRFVFPPVYVGNHMGDSVYVYWVGGARRWFEGRNILKYDKLPLDSYVLDPPIDYYPDL